MRWFSFLVFSASAFVGAGPAYSECPDNHVGFDEPSANSGVATFRLTNTTGSARKIYCTLDSGGSVTPASITVGSGICNLSITLQYTSATATQLRLWVGSAGNNPLGYFAVPANPEPPPVGHLDILNNYGFIAGWAAESAMPNAVMEIDFYLDGPVGIGRYIGSTQTGLPRPDVLAAWGFGANSGFTYQIPSWLLDGYAHTLYGYMIDPSGDGINPLLPGAPQSFLARATKFGILYDLWHCLATTTTTHTLDNGAQWTAYKGPNAAVWDTSLALSGLLPWVTNPGFSFVTQPQPGYYCLTEGNGDQVLTQHASLLTAAGIDFVIIDASNTPYQDNAAFDNGKSRISIVDPFSELIKVWSGIPNAPKVVVFAPIVPQAAPGTAAYGMFDYLMAQLDAHPLMEFLYQGRPLALVTANPTFIPDSTNLAAASQKYTVRTMWAMSANGGSSVPVQWNFMQSCGKTTSDQQAFVAAGGTIPCNQAADWVNNTLEHISVTSSYQNSYASYFGVNNPNYFNQPNPNNFPIIDVPKFHGNTFAQQFAMLSQNPGAPIVTIDAWNEWMGQRICASPSSGSDPFCLKPDAIDHWANGNKIFVDSYDYDHDRNLEPSAGAPGDYYYQLMKECISRFRNGQANCAASDIPYRVPAQTSFTPRIVSLSTISPPSGAAGTTITLTGSGFSPSGNVAYFDTITSQVANLSSGDGATLSVPTPSNLSSGVHTLWVYSANGTSNHLSFTVP